MLHHKRFLLIALIFLFACQPATARVTLLVDGQARNVTADNATASEILAQAGITFSASDKVLVNGVVQNLNQTLSQTGAVTVQLLRAVPVTLIAPHGQVTLNTSAPTVAGVILEAGMPLTARDRIEPSAETAVSAGMLIHITPAREFTVSVAGRTFNTRSAASTIGQALAEVGIPLMGLDQSTPSEFEALPADGQIRIVRISESTSTALKIIPYEVQLIVTSDLPAPQQEVLEPGQAGLTLTRTRTRYADGAEVSRTIESESILSLPVPRVVRSSYWAAKQMYATSYSPCRSGVSSCLYGTSLGLPVKRGVVAMYYDWYIALGGERVYIPGYGEAIIADVGGGFPDDRPWIDLGFSDDDYEAWSGWVTVYFLAPAPANIPWFLQ